MARKKKGTAVPCGVLAFMWHLPPVRGVDSDGSAQSPHSSMTVPTVSGWISCDEICRDIHGFREVIGHLGGEFPSRSLIVAIAFPDCSPYNRVSSGVAADLRAALPAVKLKLSDG